jgi:hypothetical protein
MQKHWKALQFASILALAVFIATVVLGKYAWSYAVLFSAFTALSAYLIAVARFRDRPDSEQ